MVKLTPETISDLETILTYTEEKEAILTIDRSAPYYGWVLCFRVPGSSRILAMHHTLRVAIDELEERLRERYSTQGWPDYSINHVE